MDQCDKGEFHSPSNSLLFVYVASDVFIINELTRSVVSVDFISTKVLSLVLVAIEVKSMDESFVKVKGYSFIDKAKSIIIKIKNIKKEL